MEAETRVALDRTAVLAKSMRNVSREFLRSYMDLKERLEAEDAKSKETQRNARVIELHGVR